MINATANPQRIVLFGGTSDLGLEIVATYLRQFPAHVVLATRAQSTDRAAAEERMRAEGARSVRTVDFDAADPASHAATVEAAWADGDVDVAIVAFGQLGDADRLWRDQPRLVDFMTVNFTGAVSLGALLANRMTAQGHGQMIVLSSVAGDRVRRSNFVYGSAKAGLDAFFTNLGDALDRTGVRVLVARPGMVRTAMTAGLKDAPLTQDPDVAARQIVAAAQQGRRVVWVPAAFRLVSLVLHHIPGPIFRRLPL
ncbi:MAG: decaprenylphospho-beta-D-erythro-pentofuranosid-2-ulose 2-reductase [Propionibacteriaceae bacterium]|jgi:decaprenylphospho-beta-D-erythro-pentofuranosid-2-ulose 2-reductase|nr:decaprenylphospho-beta-D-erythro-pentofuranosid-2-ulose 2-reductase [Propionibacteriaceae bacterium]